MSAVDADDRELMTEVSAGRMQAFSRLHQRFGARAYRVAHAVCQDDGHAQDAVQEAFLIVWRRRASYRPERGSASGRRSSVSL